MQMWLLYVPQSDWDNESPKYQPHDEQLKQSGTGPSNTFQLFIYFFKGHSPLNILMVGNIDTHQNGGSPEGLWEFTCSLKQTDSQFIRNNVYLL